MAQQKNPFDRLETKDASLELTPSQVEALRMLDTYQEHVLGEREDFGEHAHRTADLAWVFAGNDLPPQAIVAAYLHDLYDRSVGDDIDKSAVASMCLEEYFNGLSAEDGEYIMSLVNDMVEIEDIASAYRNLGGFGSEVVESDQGLWTREAPGIPLDDMFQLSKDVNIESVLIKSCEMLDNLHNPADDHVASAHDVYETESFYAPLCEVLGYDGLAMELRSHATQNRLIRQGKENQMYPVVRTLNEMRQLGPQSVLARLADEPDDFDLMYVVNQPKYIEKYSDTSYESVQLGEFSLQVDGRVMAGNWRIKSVGSLLKKLDRNVERTKSGESVEVPMDVMGMTVISNDIDTMAKDFRATVMRVAEGGSLIPQRAPSKRHPFVVQGDREYIDRVCAELGEDFVSSHVDVIENEKGYRVSKFTCLGEDDMPIEMQFVTKADRESARVGEWAHIFHKLKESGITYSSEEKKLAAKQLWEIRERKKHLHDHPDQVRINPRSAIRGARAMMALRRNCELQRRSMVGDNS